MHYENVSQKLQQLEKCNGIQEAVLNRPGRTNTPTDKLWWLWKQNKKQGKFIKMC